MTRKHRLYIAIIMILIIAVFSGCQNKLQSVKMPDSQETEKLAAATPVPPVNKYYDSYMSGKRPIAVMIDNDGESSRPHAGLEDACMVYEVVVEGGATRLMAIFRGVNTEKIGPVRSSRHYFLDYMKEYNSIYVHFGWSPQAGSEITSTNIEKINGILSSDAGAFWREAKYKGDYHSAYTSMKKIGEYADTKGFARTSDKRPLQMSSVFIAPKGDAAEKISLKYAGFYRVGYTYDAEKKLYMRSINGAPHLSQKKEQLSATNIIIMSVKNYNIGDGSPRQQVETVGTGGGYYISGGKSQAITWSKKTRDGVTKFTDADGKDIVLNPGQTWLQVVPVENNAVID